MGFRKQHAWRTTTSLPPSRHQRGHTGAGVPLLEPPVTHASAHTTQTSTDTTEAKIFWAFLHAPGSKFPVSRGLQGRPALNAPNAHATAGSATPPRGRTAVGVAPGGGAVPTLPTRFSVVIVLAVLYVSPCSKGHAWLLLLKVTSLPGGRARRRSERLLAT